VLEPVCLSLEASMVVPPRQKIRAEVYGNICTEIYIDSYCNTWSSTNETVEIRAEVYGNICAEAYMDSYCNT